MSRHAFETGGLARHSGDVFRLGRPERGVLRVRADFARVLRAAAEGKVGDARVVTIGVGGDGGEVEAAVGQREAIAERAVGAQIFFAPSFVMILKKRQMITRAFQGR